MIHAIQPLPVHRLNAVELVHEDDRYRVHPRSEETNAFAPFALPALPLSLVIDAGLMMDCFHARYR